ncbi:MAG: QueT transporter family protein [Eubacteriaceae bacterium]
MAYFTPSAIPGLALGCLLSNLSSPLGLVDIIFGTAATAISAYIATKIKNKFLVPLPYIIINSLIIGGILSYMLHVNFAVAALWVSVGQALAIYILGLPIIIIIEKNKYLNNFFTK